MAMVSTKERELTKKKSPALSALRLAEGIWRLTALVAIFLGLAIAKDSLLVAGWGVLIFLTVLTGYGMLIMELKQRRARKRKAMSAPPLRPRFSVEEQAVLGLLARGLNIGQIASKLDCSYAWASVLTVSVLKKHAAANEPAHGQPDQRQLRPLSPIRRSRKPIS